MRRSLVAISCLSFFLTGCPDDGDGSGETGAGTGDPTSAGTMSGGTMDPSESMSGGTMDPSATSTPGSGSGDPVMCDPMDAALIQMCKDEAAGEGQCPEVGDCNCDACMCELGACEMDEGCTNIRNCAQETGCLGLQCLEPEFCMEVIDTAGGLAGTSAQIALALSNCVEGAGCPTQCEGGTDTGGTNDTGTAGG